MRELKPGFTRVAAFIVFLQDLTDPLTLMVKDGVHGSERRPRCVTHSRVQGRGEGEARSHRVLEKVTLRMGSYIRNRFVLLRTG